MNDDKGFTFPFCVVNYVLRVLVENITCLIKVGLFVGCVAIIVYIQLGVWLGPQLNI